jgi:hypothetical protein
LAINPALAAEELFFGFSRSLFSRAANVVELTRFSRA